MGSDRARVTFDPGRKYRRVVAQQGRAIVEADLNEAQVILAEEMRHEALDIVGPAGTPDNGYRIVIPATLPGPALPITAVDESTSSFTSVNHNLSGGQPISFATDPGGTLPSPLVAGTIYYVQWIDHDHFGVLASGMGPVVTFTSGGMLPFHAVLPLSPYDFQVSPGTMYVGGLRVTLDAATLYSNQPDWMGGDMTPNKPRPPNSSPGNELVYLQLTEIEVSAAEDVPLREVALGGPDTAQRTRILQQIMRLQLSSTSVTTCSAADRELVTLLGSEGQLFDPGTMRVKSTARLQATFNTTTTTDPCLPTTQTGYLGAENQLIRVQVSHEIDLSGGGGGGGPSFGPPVLVWAYDNASAFYRVTSLQSTGGTTTVFTLATTPVDAGHQPRPGQWAELFFPTGQLDAHGNVINQPNGFLVQIASAGYDAQHNTLTVNAALGDGPGSISGVFFVRIWEAPITLTAGTPLALPGTGLSVTLTTATGMPFVVGDYWMLALRPGAPTQVFPQRYLDAPQPPDGPRQWICPLGVIQWDAGPPVVGTVVDDCRRLFNKLISSTTHPGWLNVIVGPDDVAGGAGLQALIDRLSLGNPDPVIIGLLPGTYQITQPLVITSSHGPLTIAARRGATIVAEVPSAPSSLPTGAHPPVTVPQTSFLHGLIIADNVVHLTLEGLTLRMPILAFPAYGGTFFALYAAGAPESGPAYYYYLTNYDNNLTDYQNLNTMIGLRILGAGTPGGGSGSPVCSQRVTVRGCTFQYASTVTADYSTSVFAAGILAEGAIGDLQIHDCAFEAPPAIAPGYYSWTFGVLHVPATQLTAVAITSDEGTSWALSGTLDGSSTPGATIVPSLTTATLRNNEFFNLSSAALFYTLPGGTVAGQPALPETLLPGLAFSRNAVRSCYSGLWIFSTSRTIAWTGDSVSLLENVAMAQANTAAPRTDSLATSIAGVETDTPPDGLLGDRLILIGTSIARAFPLWRLVAGRTVSLTDPPTSSAHADGGLITLFDRVYDAEKVAFIDMGNPAATIDVSENQLIGAPYLGTASGVGLGMQLVIWDALSGAHGATAFIRDNVITGSATVAEALTVFLRGATVTGNTVSNTTSYSDSEPTFSLVAVPPPPGSTGGLLPFSATGNTFVSPSVLPARRPYMLPMQPWSYFNDEKVTIGVPSMLDPSALDYALYTLALTLTGTSPPPTPSANIAAINTTGYRTIIGSAYNISATSTYWVIPPAFNDHVMGSSWPLTGATLTFTPVATSAFPTTAGTPLSSDFESVGTYKMTNAHATAGWVNTGVSGPTNVFSNGSNVAIDFGNFTYYSDAAGTIDWWYLGATPPTSSLISALVSSTTTLTYTSAVPDAPAGQFWWLAQLPVNQTSLPPET